jgi:peptidoglycan LD-endopeptidase LytH
LTLATAIQHQTSIVYHLSVLHQTTIIAPFAISGSGFANSVGKRYMRVLVHSRIPWILVFTLSLFIVACKTTGGLRGKKSAHEEYADALESTGLNTTVIGKLWFQAADKSLNQPLGIALPYKETGFFAAEQPRAAGYRFSAKRGEKISLTIETIPAHGIKLFGELWRPQLRDDKAILLEMIDTLTRRLNYEVEKDTDFLFRLQPELLKGIEYTLTISIQPSLAFPVQSSGSPRIISFWGAERDGGSRDHEGIDISAKFRTPVLAAADGRVVQVNENNLGGKVVFMKPVERSYRLYYAHLDSQIAVEGQRVRAGDVLGLIGNSGNARNTIPHLHFGIYTSDGPVDPFPFVNPASPKLPTITAPVKEVNQYLRVRNAAAFRTDLATKIETGGKIPESTVFRVLSASGNWYRVLFADEREGFILAAAATDQPMKQMTLQEETKLLDAPFLPAPARRVIPADMTVSVMGLFGNYFFIEYENERGWIVRKQ